MLHVKFCTIKNFLQYRINNTNSAVTYHYNNVKSLLPTYVYVANEGFKAEMDVTMSAISDFKSITYFLDFQSKAGYISTFIHTLHTYIHTYIYTYITYIHTYIHVEDIVQFACSCNVPYHNFIYCRHKMTHRHHKPRETKIVRFTQCYT